MKTPPQWINRLAREYQPEAFGIWEEHRRVVREAHRVFDDALEKPRARRDKSIASANERYREAKRALRDRSEKT